MRLSNVAEWGDAGNCNVSISYFCFPDSRVEHFSVCQLFPLAFRSSFFAFLDIGFGLVSVTLSPIPIESHRDCKA